LILFLPPKTKDKTQNDTIKTPIETMTDSMAQQQQPVLIPIHSNGEIPEWAMLEVNGELIVPKESPEGAENFADDSLIRPQDMELGAVDFIDEVCTIHVLYVHSSLLAS
jgi:hypothetical protein